MAPSRGKPKVPNCSHPHNKKSMRPSRDTNQVSQGNHIQDSVAAVTNSPPQPPSPLTLQQSLLQVFATAFPTLLDPNTTGTVLQPLLQQIKYQLFHRDFQAAFGRREYLEAYAVRWSASRALAYLDVFRETFAYLSPSSDSPAASDPVRVVCLGGGAGAELVALASLQRFLASADALELRLGVTAIDLADWSPLLSVLHDTVTSISPLSPYASPSARAAHVALSSSEALHCTFHQMDLLTLFQPKALGKPDDAPNQSAAEGLRSTTTAEATASLSQASLVTLMFTLNELYTTSRSLTQSLLFGLTARTRPGTLLLVVDSPGSYSTVTLGGASGGATRNYPMSWLLNHALLRAPEEPAWQKLVAEESRWFRLPDDGKGGGGGGGGAASLRYPIPLENMRYQMHLYRRVLISGEG